MFILKKNDLKSLLSSWSKDGEVFAPQLEGGQVMLLPYEENKFTMDYINFAFPLKEYLFKQKEILFNWKKDNGNISVETPRNMNGNSRIYFGIRPCDIYGLKYMDKFFLEGYKDEFYWKNRNEAVIIAINCSKPGGNCFCSSMGTGPFANSGYDLLFTPLKDEFLIEIGTRKGEELTTSSRNLLTQAEVSLVKEKSIVEKDVLNKFANKINTVNVSKLLEESFTNPIWLKLSKTCISCTGCTSLCPTCTCFNIVEESKGANCGCRVRYWDSCQNDSFTRNAKEHNPRSGEARVRYRIYDKFKYIEDKFNIKGCTGCGRCINVCPASINVVDIINELADSNLSVEGSEGK
jgi:ferredoxin